jgi:hypothetical protein
MYKGHTSQPSIVDSDGTALDINVGSNNSLLTLFTDLSGVPLKTEHSNTGSALYTSIKDHPVTLGNDDGKALIVAIRDGDHDISAVNGSVLVHPSNNIGYSQASTTGVAVGNSSGVAMYLSLTDASVQISTTKNNSNINAMYVAMTLSGVLVGPNNPLPAVITTETTPAANHFDISTGIKADQFYTHSDISSTGLNLFNLYTYNDGAVPVWTKVYDMSAGYITTDVSANNSRYHSRIRLNVATPPGTYRDLKFPRGLTFNNGMWFRSTTEPTYDSNLGPGESALFVNGCYYRPSGVRNLTTSNKIADIPSFPDLALGGLTGLEDLKTIDFISDHVAGSVTFSYNQQEQLLSLSTIIERGAVISLAFAFDDETYDIDLSDYKLNHPLVTDNISITPEQLETSRLNIVLDNGTTLSVGWHVN